MKYIAMKVNAKGLCQPEEVSFEEAQRIYAEHCPNADPLSENDGPTAFCDDNFKDFLWVLYDEPITGNSWIMVNGDMRFWDTPEKAKADSQFRTLNYHEDRFRQYFCSPWEQHADKVGQKFEVIGPVDESELEPDSENMYHIQFEDGSKIQAFAHEICVLIYDQCL